MNNLSCCCKSIFVFDNLDFRKKKYFDRMPDNLDIFTEKEDTENAAYGKNLVLRMFHNFEEISRDKDFKFIVINIPTKININKEYQKKFLNQWSDVDETYFEFRKIDDIFTETLFNSEYPIEYISLFDLAENNFDEFYFKTDPHWNPKGVKLSADYITEELRNKKLING